MASAHQTLELALHHHRLHHLGEAEQLCHQVLALEPTHAGALHLLGIIAGQRGQPQMALQFISTAIAFLQDNPAAHCEAQNNLGLAFTGLGQWDDAINAFRRALQIRPDFSVCRKNLGIALTHTGHLDEARAELESALTLDCESTEALNHLALVLVELGLVEEAIATYRRLSAFEPANLEVQSAIIGLLHFVPGTTAQRVAEEQARWHGQFAASTQSFAVVHLNRRDPERRLRIGYVSSDLYQHAVAWNLIPLFEGHNRREFELLCYSGVSKPDPVTHELQKRADLWRSTVGISDDSLAEMIRQDGVDLLVDLNQHTTGNRLPVFARRPTPVQVSFAAYPGRTGLPAIEYRISDRWLESPSKNADVSAEHVSLIDSFWCYARPSGINLNISPVAHNGYVTFGNFSALSKINDFCLKLWSRVLLEVKNSRLMLRASHASVRQRILHVLASEGIDSSRIEFVERCPRKEYLERYHQIHIVLDTFPYNGHTTTLDALWMGVPVISLAGESPVSRGGLSQLSNLGLPELVAFAEDDFVRIAVELANDWPRLDELRQTLRGRMESSVLMDAPRYARNIEAAYRAMWRRWCSVPAC